MTSASHEHHASGGPARRGEDARWGTGPDPDAPPWAERDRSDGRGARPGDQEERPADSSEDPGTAGSHRPGAGPSDPLAAGDDHGPTPDDEPTSLAEVAPGMQPPRPPRRTGVFVDPEDLRDYVGGLLRAILGGYEVDAFGNYTFVHEGARVFVTVGGSPIGPQVGVFSVTNLELDLTPQLGQFLLTTNHRLGFGSFSYDPQNNAVWLRHALLGTTLDGPELQAAVAAIASTAAAMDHEIRERFGGRTFTEAPSEVQRRMGPPDPGGSGPAAGGYL
jgi:hypothetical protein